MNYHALLTVPPSNACVQLPLTCRAEATSAHYNGRHELATDGLNRIQNVQWALAARLKTPAQPAFGVVLATLPAGRYDATALPSRYTVTLGAGGRPAALADRRKLGEKSRADSCTAKGTVASSATGRWLSCFTLVLQARHGCAFLIYASIRLYILVNRHYAAEDAHCNAFRVLTVRMARCWDRTPPSASSSISQQRSTMWRCFSCPIRKKHRR